MNEAVVSSLLKKTDFLRRRVRSKSSRQNKNRKTRAVEIKIMKTLNLKMGVLALNSEKRWVVWTQIV